MARGSKRKRSRRTWELRWDGPRGEDGERNQDRATFKGTAKEADDELNRIMADLGKSEAQRRSEMPVADFCALFLEERNEVDLRPGSVSEYERVFRRHLLPECGQMPLGSVDRDVLQRVIRRMIDSGLAPATVHTRHALLSGLFRHAVKWKYILESPVADLTLPEHRHKSAGKLLSREKASEVLAVFENTCYWLPTFLGLHTGMRSGEVLGLTWDDVDLDAGTLSVRHTLHRVKGRAVLGLPKTDSSERVVAVSPEVVEVLREREERRPRECWYTFLETVGQNKRWSARQAEFKQLCAEPDGRIVTVHSWDGAFRRKFRADPIGPIRPHDLRHTHASLLLLNGVPIHVVSKRLGHANIQTTIREYGHLLPNSDADAAAQFAVILMADPDGRA